MLQLHYVDLGPGVIAGFTDRFGGVSTDPWNELNLGVNTSDDPARVRRNRALLAARLGVPVAFATQVHGNRVLSLDARDVVAWADPQPPLSVGEGDAMVTTAPLGLGVLVADCVPIILADAKAGVVAVAHAGRRGVETNVIAEAVNAMRAAGAADILAAVGPAICGRCYEVPPDMQAAVCAVAPAARSTTNWGSTGLDLPAAALAQLRQVGAHVVGHLDRCTMEDARWYSHRRATLGAAAGGSGLTGRFAGFVGLLPVVGA